MSVAPGWWPVIAAVGAAAAVMRVWLDGAVSRHGSGRFPFGTLTVNLTGALALGVLQGAGLGSTPLLIAGTAGLGTFTTFSTLVYETERLLEDGDRLAAALNLGGSMAAGLAVVALGFAAGRAL